MTWWRRLWHRKSLETQLEKELRFHLEEHTARLAAQGVAGGDAQRQARLALGGPEQVKEACRDARGTRWMEDLAQDVRYAWRTLRQRPGFTAIALLTLALGSGATTVMFTLINSVLLSPLPYRDSARLVSLHEKSSRDGSEWAFAYLNFLDCRRESKAFAGMAAWRYGGAIVSEPGDPEYARARQISAGLFSLLGIPLERGRGFLPEEDRPGGAPVAIISDRLWRSRYHDSSRAIGERLVFGPGVYTIVGIAPAGFQLAGEADVFTPLGQFTAPTMQNREMHPGIQVIGRLRSGVTLVQAQAELALIGQRLARAYPKSNAGQSFAAKPLRTEMVGDTRSTLWLLLGAVSLVLLIACANVASLLLARAVSRERESAMRMALGAGRGRLIRQHLTESVVLALGGGTLGLGLASTGLRPFLLLWPGGLPRASEVHVDWRVFLFALAASLLCGLLFGLAPAATLNLRLAGTRGLIRAPVRNLEQTLRAGARTLTGGSRRLHGAFVTSEIALAIVLLIAAAMLARTVLRLSSLDPGFVPKNVLVARVTLSSGTLANANAIRAAWRDVLARCRAIPGVQSAAVSDMIPMEGEEEAGYWTTPAPPPTNRMPLASMNLVTPGYLGALGLRLERGRFIDDADRAGSEHVAVIDAVLAKHAFGGGNVLGRRLNVEFFGPVRVVGVVEHILQSGLGSDEGAAVRDQIYFSYLQLPDDFVQLTAAGMYLTVRTRVPPLTLEGALRKQVRGAARDQALYDARTMEQVVAATLARQRFLLLLFGIFSGLALLLASTGIYGVLAYLTRRRVPEFGVRMALGATAGDVVALVLRQSLAMILCGFALGALASLAAARLLVHLVPSVQPIDPATLALVLAVLGVATLLASYLPAHRAGRTDPVVALREE